MSVLALPGKAEKASLTISGMPGIKRAESKRTTFIISFLRRVKTGLIQNFFPGKGHQASNPDFTTK